MLNIEISLRKHLESLNQDASFVSLCSSVLRGLNSGNLKRTKKIATPWGRTTAEEIIEKFKLYHFVELNEEEEYD